MTSMRILMIATGAYTSGGGEKHVLDLSTGLIDRGHHVMLMAPGGGDVLDVAAQLGCDVREAPSLSAFSCKAAHSLAHLRETWKPDIVHAHGPRAAYVVRRGDTGSIPRLVYTNHGIHAGHGLLGGIKLAVERADVDKVAAYITTCEADKTESAKLGILIPERTAVVYNGVPVPTEVEKGRFRAELALDSDTSLALHVGRANLQKDHSTLLQAFDATWRSVTRKPKLVMIVGGSDTQRAHLKRQTFKLACGDDVIILEPRVSLAEAYTDADLFVLSSLWEARPYVLVEAMQYGCPVVSTDVGGVAEAVEDGVTGLLTPAKDARALADAMTALLDDGERRMSMGQAAQRSMVGRFTLDEMVDQTIAVYRQVSK